MKTRRCVAIKVEVCLIPAVQNPAGVQIIPPISIRHYAELLCGHQKPISTANKDLILHAAGKGEFVNFDCEECE